MKITTLLGLAVFSGVTFAGPMFTQCPAVGANTGCQFLITIASDGTVGVAQDTNPPNNGPYDSADDTLVGVLNNSSNTITSLPLSSSSADIFGFESDGPCSQSIHPASCPSSAGFPGDSTGYGGPGITYGHISANSMSGTVFFTNGVAPGGSAWFGLEAALSSTSQITPGSPGTGSGGTVPEPATMLLMGAGLAALSIVRRRRSA